MPQYYDAEGNAYTADDSPSGGARTPTIGRIGIRGRPPPNYSPHFRQKERQPLESPYFPIFLGLVTLVDIAVFIYEMVKNGGFEPFSVNPMGGPSAQTLVDLGAKYGPCIVLGDWWRFITPMFLHGGIVHILLNLWTQIRVGFSLERSYGFMRIAPVYIGGGIMGNLLSAIFIPNVPSVGASSSLMGLVGLMLIDIIVNWSTLKNPCLALCEYFCLLIVTLVIGLLPFIDNYAHIGGYIGGLLLGMIFIPGTRHLFPQSNETCSDVCPRFTCKIFVVILFAGITTAAFVVGFTIFYKQIPATGWCPNCEYIDCVNLPNYDWCDYGTPAPVYTCPGH